jgi:hypothetical protein
MPVYKCTLDQNDSRPAAKRKPSPSPHTHTQTQITNVGEPILEYY